MIRWSNAVDIVGSRICEMAISRKAGKPPPAGIDPDVEAEFYVIALRNLRLSIRLAFESRDRWSEAVASMLLRVQSGFGSAVGDVEAARNVLQHFHEYETFRGRPHAGHEGGLGYFLGVGVVPDESGNRTPTVSVATWRPGDETNTVIALRIPRIERWRRGELIPLLDAMGPELREAMRTGLDWTPHRTP